MDIQDMKKVRDQIEAFVSNPKSETSHRFVHEAVCPWCGYEHSDSWEYDDGGTYCCDNCDNNFELSREITVMYYTAKVGEDEHKKWYEEELAKQSEAATHHTR